MQRCSEQSGNDKYSQNQRAGFYPDKRSMRRVGRVLSKRGRAALRSDSSKRISDVFVTIKTD